MTGPALLLAALLLVLLLLAALLGLARAGQGQKALAARLARVAASPVAPGGALPARPRDSRLRALAARVLGLCWERAPFYPLRWWLVPLLALAAARVACGLAEALLGAWVLWAWVPLAWLLCRWGYARFHAMHREQLFRQFPDALGMVVRAVGVGVPATEAVAIVAREALEPTATEFRRAADRLALGATMETALAETARHNGVPEYRMFATALALQGRTGGGLRELLESLAGVIRRRVAIRSRAWALAAEVRLSASILAALPFVTGGMLALIDPGYIGFLFTDPQGRMALAAASGLLLAGVVTMREMIRRSLA